MEQQLFFYENSDSCGDLVLHLRGVELKVAMGPYDAGQHFSEVFLSYDAGTVELWQDACMMWRGKLKLEVVL